MRQVIHLTQYRAISWQCLLCQQEHTVSEKDYCGASGTLTYGCACGKVYRVRFEGAGSVEEDTALESLFAITRHHSGLEVRLAWDKNKGAWASIEREDWSRALAQAIGLCWQQYASEIIAHIKETQP